MMSLLLSRSRCCLASLSLTLAGAALFFTGCTTTYKVDVDAIHDPSADVGKSYRIVPRQPGFEERDADYPEAVELLKNALGGRGMYEAPNPQDADVVVIVDYGVGPLRTEIETNRGADTIDPLMRGVGIASPSRRIDPMMDPNSIMLPDGRMVQPILPEDTVRTKQVYDKHLSISAREVTTDETGAQKTGKELWRVEVTVEQSKDDMAQALPVLAGAASDYIGTNTGSRQSIRVSEDSPSVVFVKGEK